jgi:hypothetical protein
MPAFSPEVLSDPLGVVTGLLARRAKEIDADALSQLVITVAPGRAVRRRLAQALTDRPAVLEDGRSPAPRVVAELLLAMHALSDGAVSPPRCKSCDKALSSFQHRGEDWYCGVCGPRRVPCTNCARVTIATSKDRDGRPRCSSCPPEGREPLEVVTEVVRGIDAGLHPDTVRAAVESVTSRAGQRRQLAWALEDRPELLTGTGAEAPTPAVLRLIDELIAVGATAIARPACPRCHRVVTLSKLDAGVRICRGCQARLRAVPCARCTAVRDPVTRDENGGAICANCFVNDPVNQEDCRGCGRRRPVAVRTPDGPLCASCRPIAEMTCAICARTARCEIAKATGKPWCTRCQQRWARCSGCGTVRQVRGGTAERPLCATCTRADRSFWKACPTCGELTKLTVGPCVRCALRDRLGELLSGPTGAIRPELRGLMENLAGVERPLTVLGWLAGSEAVAVLGELGQGRLVLSHSTLDQLPSAKPVEHLRAVLVATGALPERDEQMAQLELWVTATISSRAHPDERHLLSRYAVWHLLRRLRRRGRGTETTYAQTRTLKARVKAAIQLLDWLTAADVTLATANQGHLDAWLASDGAVLRRDAGHFVRWAAEEHLASLDLPAVRWRGPTGAIDAEGRWEDARRLLQDDTADLPDRVAGLLVVLYAQRAASISRLTVGHVEIDSGGVRLHLGARPATLPEPLAAMVADLVASRRGHAVLGNTATTAWLFPGGRPGRPISASRLTERLRAIGIWARPSRSAALFQLAAELPAAVLARLLGVHIQVAVEWQRISSGDWTGYAADYSRRDAPRR